MEEILSLAKRKGAEDAEVFLAVEEETSVVFEANRLKQIENCQSMIVALRVIKESRIGFSSATSLNDHKLLVERAIEAAQFGPRAVFELPSHIHYPKVRNYHHEVETFPVESMISQASSLISSLREHTPQLLCEAEVSKSVTTIQLLNSRGGEMEYRQTLFSLGVEGILIRDEDMLFVGDSQSSCQLLSEPSKISGSVVTQLERAKRTAVAPIGRLPVIFTPLGLVSAFIAPLSSAFNGKVVLQGASPLGGKVGETVFDQRLSLWDNSLIDDSPGSYPGDGEGIPGQRTPLIENGVVKNFLYDLQTAGLAGTTSTGNGIRSGGLPAPSISSLIFATGDTNLEEMIHNVKEGLLVEQLMGAEQTNILGGEFSGNVLLGYKIENGEIIGRVKNTVVSGNVYTALAELGALGSEARWVGGAIFAPPICCADLTIGSKG